MTTANTTVLQVAGDDTVASECWQCWSCEQRTLPHHSKALPPLHLWLPHHGLFTITPPVSSPLTPSPSSLYIYLYRYRYRYRWYRYRCTHAFLDTCSWVLLWLSPFTHRDGPRSLDAAAHVSPWSSCSRETTHAEDLPELHGSPFVTWRTFELFHFS